MGIFKLRGQHPVIYDLYKEDYSDQIVKDDEMRFTMRKDKTLNQKAWYITSRLGMVSFNENGKMFFPRKSPTLFQLKPSARRFMAGQIVRQQSV